MTSRCDAKTKTGERCKRNRVSGEAFCHTHKNIEETKNMYCKKCVELGCGASAGPIPPLPPPPPTPHLGSRNITTLLRELKLGGQLRGKHVFG